MDYKKRNSNIAGHQFNGTFKNNLFFVFATPLKQFSDKSVKHKIEYSILREEKDSETK